MTFVSNSIVTSALSALNVSFGFGDGSFGEVIFTVNSSYIKTFDEFSRRSASRYSDHEVAGKKPISEFIANELDEITFNIQLNRTYCSPERELTLLNKIKTNGIANRLIIGSRNLGKFTLREIEENLTHVGKNGILLFVDVSLTLVEYIDSFSNNAATALREDEVMRSKTGKGGPERLPGSSQPSLPRSLLPLYGSNND